MMLSSIYSLLLRLDPTILSARMLGATIAALVLPPLLTVLYILRRVATRPQRKNSVLILVLGDIGRSPRMMYHASSFARHEWETVLLGYTDTPLIPALLETPHIYPISISSPPRFVMALPWIIRAPVRIAYQIISIIRTVLFTLPVHPEIIMVQNPPSIPTLFLARYLAGMCKSKLVIDWHNTGYSILAMRTGEASILVRIAKWFEMTFGRKAHAHLFVTRALESFLSKEWSLM
jgi:beta-1,4-mannosyltransferase